MKRQKATKNVVLFMLILLFPIGIVAISQIQSYSTYSNSISVEWKDLTQWRVSHMALDVAVNQYGGVEAMLTPNHNPDWYYHPTTGDWAVHREDWRSHDVNNWAWLYQCDKGCNRNNPSFLRSIAGALGGSNDPGIQFFIGNNRKVFRHESNRDLFDYQDALRSVKEYCGTKILQLRDIASRVDVENDRAYIYATDIEGQYLYRWNGSLSRHNNQGMWEKIDRFPFYSSSGCKAYRIDVGLAGIPNGLFLPRIWVTTSDNRGYKKVYEGVMGATEKDWTWTNRIANIYNVQDIGVQFSSKSLNPVVWAIGGRKYGSAGYQVYKLNYNNYRWYKAYHAYGKRVSVDPDGNPWIVDGYGRIMKGIFFPASSPPSSPSKPKDIAVIWYSNEFHGTWISEYDNWFKTVHNYDEVYIIQNKDDIYNQFDIIDSKETAQSRVFIYIHGHGSFKKGRAFSLVKIRDESGIRLTSNIFFSKLINRLESREIKVMVDTCKAGGFVNWFFPTKNCIMITSCDACTDSEAIANSMEGCFSHTFWFYYKQAWDIHTCFKKTRNRWSEYHPMIVESFVSNRGNYLDIYRSFYSYYYRCFYEYYRRYYYNYYYYHNYYYYYYY